MQEKYLYDYAVIRVVPKVEREEFVNLGVIVYCKPKKFLKVKYHIPKEKLNHFSTELDLEDLEKNLLAFKWITEGAGEGGRIAELEPAERFRWLTAVRSSCIQTSRPHSGFTEDPEATLDRLFEHLVL
ncbi:DUF3037 domain-containing protein [Robertkochia flava]|uniref:DUF3037 domain-containing protein n=1 Tax=Robertkochia flava TaxID=3447986 RepID=UPI001CCD3F84|nr:DUF3037 domain-containing protein [Robertkochia marina]